MIHLKQKSNKDFSKEPIQQGWSKYLEHCSNVIKELPFAKIVSIGRRIGMLQINFEPVDNLEKQFILDALSYRYERLSAVTCEHCGVNNYRIVRRRKDLHEVRSLCNTCYPIRYSEEYDDLYREELKEKETQNVLDKGRPRLSFD